MLIETIVMFLHEETGGDVNGGGTGVGGGEGGGGGSTQVFVGGGELSEAAEHESRRTMRPAELMTP